MRLGWFLAFFFASGFCSLVYEVIWLRSAMASFGVTVPLTSIVLSVFMAGLALGSWLVGALVRRLDAAPARRFLELYAGAELFIAAGLVVPQALAWGRGRLGELGGGAWGSSSYYLLSGAWIALTLLPFTLAMGATFPLAMAAIRKSLGGERSFGALYFANVVGATAGTFASAFFMVELLGFRGTLRVTAVVNVLLAASALAVSRFAGATAVASRPRGAAPVVGPAASSGMLGLLFLTGFVSMAMEVIWIRQFTPYVGTVVYAFASILICYLTATFVGSRLYLALARGWGAAAELPGAALGWALLGVASLLPLALGDPRLPEARGFSRVAIGIMPVCALLGALTPLLVDRWSRGDPDRAGGAYAVNILGGILGPLASGFVLLPLLGERWSLLVLAAPLFVVGAVTSLRRRSPAASPWPVEPRPLFITSVVLGLLLLVLTRDFETRFAQRVVRRDDTATVIATGEGMQRRLLVNGIGMTGLGSVTKMMAHLPLAHRTEPAASGLVVCFGMGTSFRSVLSWGIDATAVELVPSVPSLFDYYHPDGARLLRSPRAHIVVDDGRRFLERASASWDVITIDPPPPVEAAGSSLLYSREFYAVIKRRLRADGILQQWLPGADPTTVAAVARALGEAFPFVRVFRSSQGWGLHFLASERPLPVVPATTLARRLPIAADADLLEWEPESTAEEEFRLVLAGEIPLAALTAAAPGAGPLRDDQPVNEYFLVRKVVAALGRLLAGERASASTRR